MLMALGQSTVIAKGVKTKTETLPLLNLLQLKGQSRTKKPPTIKNE